MWARCRRSLRPGPTLTAARAAAGLQQGDAAHQHAPLLHRGRALRRQVHSRLLFDVACGRRRGVAGGRLAVLCQCTAGLPWFPKPALPMFCVLCKCLVIPPTSPPVHLPPPPPCRSKNLKQLLARKALPDLGRAADVAEFLTRSGYGSVRCPGFFTANLRSSRFAGISICLGALACCKCATRRQADLLQARATLLVSLPCLHHPCLLPCALIFLLFSTPPPPTTAGERGGGGGAVAGGAAGRGGGPPRRPPVARAPL